METFAQLMNLAITEEYVPSEWRKSFVVPLYKRVLPKMSTLKMSTPKISTLKMSTPKMSTSQNVNSQNVNSIFFIIKYTVIS